MQFINSFVNAVANGASMLMMSSNPNSSTNLKVMANQSNTLKPSASEPSCVTSTPIQPSASLKNSMNHTVKSNSRTPAVDNSKNEGRGVRADLAVAFADEEVVLGNEETDDEKNNSVVASKADQSGDVFSCSQQKNKPSSDSQVDQVASGQKSQQPAAGLNVEEVNPADVVEVVVNNPVNDVNKRTNRKSYSEVILTESSSSTTNSDFRMRQSSISLSNSAAPNRTNCASTTPGRPYTANNNNTNSNKGQPRNNNWNNNQFNSKSNRHSLCVVSAPNSTRNSTTFNNSYHNTADFNSPNRPNQRPNFNKTKSFNYNSSINNNNRPKFNKQSNGANSNNKTNKK